jgi:hypothetical protein
MIFAITACRPFALAMVAVNLATLACPRARAEGNILNMPRVDSQAYQQIVPETRAGPDEPAYIASCLNSRGTSCNKTAADYQCRQNGFKEAASWKIIPGGNRLIFFEHDGAYARGNELPRLNYIFQQIICK